MSLRDLRTRVERMADDAGPCPSCDWPELPEGTFHVIIRKGDPLPQHCAVCGRPQVLVIEEVIVTTREEAAAAIAACASDEGSEAP